MAKLFGILTAFVLALAAFVAFKNKAAYETKITETATAKDLLIKSKARLAEAEKTRDVDLPAEIAGVVGEVEKLTASEEAQNKANTALKAQVDAKTTKIAANKEQLDGIRAKTEKTGDLKELASKMRATNAELEELAQSITGAEAKLANLTAQNSSSEAQVSATKGKFENYASGQSLPSLKTRIRSIYPNWGFVTLAAGNGAGIVTNSTLDVVRDGQTVAKLLVTAVESNSASASIVPDSLSAETTLMVGDRVVPGTKAAKPAGN